MSVVPSGTLVIFDCDGVLVDSEPIASEVFSQAVTELGLIMSPQEADSAFRGRSLPDCLAILERRLGHEVPQDFLPALTLATKTAFADRLRPIPFIREVLLALQEEHVPMCVASSGSLQKIKHSLQLTSLLEFFCNAEGSARLFSAEQVERGKPAPDLFLHAARNMGYPPARCIVIEDSQAGVQAAQTALMDVLAFVPAQSPPEQSEFFASLGVPVFRAMSELPDQLAQRSILTDRDRILPGRGPC